MGSPEYNTAYGAKLTDGIAAKELNFSNNSWFFFQKGKNASADGVGTVTVDLGGYYDFSKARVHLANVGTNMGIYAPKSVKLYGSLDGSEYGLLGEFATDDSDTIVYWSEISSSEEGVTVKYVRFEFTVNSSSIGTYLNEIEFYGTESDYTPEESIEGDVNGDGCLDMFDYMLVKTHHFKKYTLSEEEFKKADVCKDGAIDVFDYMMLKSLCLNQ